MGKEKKNDYEIQTKGNFFLQDMKKTQKNKVLINEKLIEYDEHDFPSLFVVILWTIFLVINLACSCMEEIRNSAYVNLRLSFF
jgi:hypothetical protein